MFPENTNFLGLPAGIAAPRTRETGAMQWRRAVVTLVAAALLALGAADPGAGAQAGDPLDAVNALLDQREAALAAGDLSAWMATVDPEAPGAFRDRQRTAFAGWGVVPVERFALDARTDDTGDLALGMQAELVGRYRADAVFLPETRRHFRLAGYDDRDTVEYLWLTYVRRGDQWYIGGDEDLRFLGLDTAVTLWELGPVEVQRSEHFLVVSPPDRAGRAQQIIELAERAWTRFEDQWDHPWSGRLPVILPGSVADLETILQTTFDLDNFVAFVAYDAIRDDGYEPTAPRMYIQDANLSRHSGAFQLDTMVHELVHAATSTTAGPFNEPWVHEGLAEWVTRGSPAGGRAPSGSDGRLPEPHEFTTGGNAAIVRSYEESTSAFAFLAGRAGAGEPVRFFEQLGARRVVPGSADHHAGDVLRAVADLDLRAFEEAWSGG